MAFNRAIETIKNKRICCGNWSKKAEYADFANTTINALEKQIELKEYIEKISKPQFESLIVGRDDLVHILNKFLARD